MAHELPAGSAGNGHAPARPSKMSTIVARSIVADIATGLKPGDTLPSETTMMQRYQVGRASVREALRVLEVSGVVHLKSGPTGGPVVEDLSAGDLGHMMALYFQILGVTFRDIIGARTRLEPLLARLAAEEGDEDLRTRLTENVEASVRAGVSDPVAYAAHAKEFHDLLAGGAVANPVLGLLTRSVSRVYESFVRARGRVRTGSRGTPPVTDDQRAATEQHQRDVIAEHQQIMNAVVAGDGATAQRLMEEHMRSFAEHASAEYELALDEVVEW
ncbi:MAG TPA: FCD domain-containing protein [Pseudonocardia sp.]|jgi:DNA-binding FadR family transcriptional regulator|nr:FCD domain-containing protein [Pseudonocardia sp.]